MRRQYTAFPLDKSDPGLKDPNKMWMPILSVRLGSKHQYTPSIQAVVDSGSPYCLARADAADFLHIKLEDGTEGKIGGVISGPSEPIFFHRCKIQVESNWIIEALVGFAKKLAWPVILGRRGFFDNFWVHFDHSKDPPELEINKIERAN